MRNLGRTSKTTRKVSALNLERELRAAPVTAVLVVLDLVVRLHTEPVGDRAEVLGSMADTYRFWRAALASLTLVRNVLCEGWWR